MKFNLFSKITNMELILGGIRENNLQLTRLINSKVFVFIEVKKAAKIPAGFLILLNGINLNAILTEMNV